MRDILLENIAIRFNVGHSARAREAVTTVVVHIRPDEVLRGHHAVPGYVLLERGACGGREKHEFVAPNKLKYEYIAVLDGTLTVKWEDELVGDSPARRRSFTNPSFMSSLLMSVSYSKDSPFWAMVKDLESPDRRTVWNRLFGGPVLFFFCTFF